MIFHQIVNGSTKLGKISSDFSVPNYINLLDVNDSMRPFYLRAVGKYIWFVCGVGWTLAIIGSYFRYILYSFIFNKHKKRQLNWLYSSFLLSYSKESLLLYYDRIFKGHKMAIWLLYVKDVLYTPWPFCVKEQHDANNNYDNSNDV